MATLHDSQSTPSTLEKLKRDLERADELQDLQVKRIKRRISTFERMYDMESSEMCDKLESGEIDETDDICLWRMDLDLLHHVTST